MIETSASLAARRLQARDEAIARHHALCARMLVAIHQLGVDGFGDPKRGGRIRIVASHRISNDLVNGLRAMEDRDGRRYPSEFTINYPQVGIIAGVDIHVDDRLGSDEMLVRWEMNA